MDFYEVLDQVVALLKQRGRASYQALRIQFKLDEESLDALKLELIEVQELATDRDGKMLVWTGETEGTPVSASQPDQTTQQPPKQQDQPTQFEPPPPESHTPEMAERRQLTVVFSDLVDSTKLSGQLDPEDYREVLRSYQATCSEVIHRFDGYIAQHLGDALLVYFGFPQAHENDAHRGILAGLGMLDAMQTLNTRLEEEKGIHLAIRVGIHTGLAVISDVGSGQKHEMLALGEAPNVASRIQGIAATGTIAMTEATYRLVEGYFDCDDLGSHTLKGVAEPVKVYRVLQESGAQSRLDVAASKGLTPLVGREQEVGLLLDRWNQVKDHQGKIVLLSGEGGIGKSRLVQVLKEHIADEPHTRWECRSSPYYQNTALYPLSDLFQHTLQWQPEDSSDEKLAKLERRLGEYRLPLEESVSLFAPLLSLQVPEERYPPLHWTPQRQRQKTLETILAILLEQAEQQPVLFILEDLHWTDPSTLELLDLLIDQVPTASLFTLLTCRPMFQPSWSSRSYLTQVTLSHLSRPQIEQIAIQVAGGKTLPTEIVQQLVDKTDGVPLYCEEMTKAILESGHLKEVNGHYELVGSLTSLTIPATLQDSLMARLDRLMTAKVIAQLGATIGRQFSYQLLQAVSQLDEATLQRELKRLVEAELVYQRGLPPQATYTFKHALVQDAGYASLLKATRQQYHQRIAQVLEERFPDTAETQPELLAQHFTEAGQSEEAIGYWYKAGQRAIERSANVEAIAHLNRGLTLLQTLPDTLERIQQELDMQIALGRVFIAVKGYANADVGNAYTRAKALCQQVGESLQTVQSLWGLSVFHYARRELQTAYEVGQQCLASARRLHDVESLIGAHSTLGTTTYSSGNFLECREHLEQGIALYHPNQHPTLVTRYTHDTGINCYNFIAQVLWMLGYPNQALARSHEMVALSQALSHPYSLAVTLFWAARLHILRREPDEALEHIAAMTALADGHAFTFLSALGMKIRGWALTHAGQMDEALREARRGVASSRATGARQWSDLALLAEAYGKAGYIDDGMSLLDEGLVGIEESRERFYEAEIHRLKGELLLQQSSNNHTEAATCFHQALEVARSQQAKSLELRAATSLARLWQQQGKRDEAWQLLSEIYGWFTEGFDTADLKDAQALLDELA